MCFFTALALAVLLLSGALSGGYFTAGIFSAPENQHRLRESRKLPTKPEGVKSLGKDIIFLKKKNLVNKLSFLFIKNSVEMKLCVVIMSKCLYLQRSVTAWMESY